MDEQAAIMLRDAMVTALIDGDLADEEKAYIDHLRQRLGVSSEEFRELVESVRADPKRLHVTESLLQAGELMATLAEVAAADKAIRPAEKAVLSKVGQKLGLTDRQVEEWIDRAQVGEEIDEQALEAAIDEVYAHFAEWDQATRQAKMDALVAFGRGGVVHLLRVLESYRTPDGMRDALDMKAMLVRALGQLGDSRAVYYLAQQVNIGDVDDEVSNESLRFAAAEALGTILGQGFPADQAGVEAARAWWQTPEAKAYDRLAF